MKINKKYLMIGLPILALGLVMVGALAYYAIFSAEFEVSQSIITSDCNDILKNVYDGETIVGSDCTITNNAPSERTISITNDAPTEIDVRYMGTLTLAEKETTGWTKNGIEKTIKYTIAGKDFIVEDMPEDMTLVYYPNTEGDDFPTNVDNMQVLGTTGNLPIALDVGDNYCGNGFNILATQCVGAKLWLLPGVLDITQAKNKVLAWDTNGFLFETELIQYSVDGTGIRMSASPNSLTITPVYTIAPYTTGSYNITTTIA